MANISATRTQGILCLGVFVAHQYPYDKGLHQAVRGIGMIAERRHTAIAIYTNGVGYQRHWMPKSSDCTYLEVGCPEIH